MFAPNWHSNAQAGGSYSYKTLTCLLLDENTDLISFGYDADYNYSRYNTAEVTNKPKEWENYYYFRNYKMAIYAREDLSDDTPIEAAGGKHLRAIVVFTRTIEFFRRELYKHFVNNGSLRKPKAPNAAKQFENFDLINATWVITVPAIWDEPAKQLMKRAALKAGINNENLVIALEPECAAIYCRQLSKSQLQIYEEEGNINHIVHPGAVLMVVDIGGK
ncbi:heat shock 70 kDa protein 12A-like [Mercenaria mercenaria]|uniref:heat shock 70 kDa protein 12A-like n=1 Tax=Mercenaria mercenaria TaxID=6596 RepID=UPI00234F8323|nr:heat shock 70 kDa protein 12A-like [Mercenaria mercenaria]